MIQTDASGGGIGAILLQNGHPLAYFSKQLTDRQQPASTYAQEMMAITEAVKKWRQYLLGRRFTVQTDHRSLRALLHQTIQTPEQQKWLYKLVGYDFDIEYKPGVLNGPADALSRMNRVSCNSLFTELRSQPVLWEAIRAAYAAHPDTLKLLSEVRDDPGQHTNFTIRHGVLFFKGRVWIPENSALQPLLLAEFHNTPTGGHAGVQRTLARIAGKFFWPGLRRSVHDYVSNCSICQSTKPFNRAPQGLLQPLPIPGKIWHSISMDFITGLPPSGGKMTIMVVVDRLSKHAHFSALGSLFTAIQVAEIMVRDLIKLHGVPAQIVSDRDPIFMSGFWRESILSTGDYAGHK